MAMTALAAFSTPICALSTQERQRESRTSSSASLRNPAANFRRNSASLLAFIRGFPLTLRLVSRSYDLVPPQPKPGPFPHMKPLTKPEQRQKFRKLSSIFHFAYKPAHFHPGILPCRVALPVMPMHISVPCLYLL